MHVFHSSSIFALCTSSINTLPCPLSSSCPPTDTVACPLSANSAACFPGKPLACSLICNNNSALVAGTASSSTAAWQMPPCSQQRR